jgi:hypothetical protein
VIYRERFGIQQHPMPQATAPDEQARGEIVFNFLPRGLNLHERQTLLKDGQTQRIAQFHAMESGEGQRRGVCLSPRIGLAGNWRQLRKGKTENWCPRRFSPAFFRPGIQNHVRQNLAPENSTAPRGIIRQRSRCLITGVSIFAKRPLIQVFQQPMDNFPPLLARQLGECLLDFQNSVHAGQHTEGVLFLRI